MSQYGKKCGRRTAGERSDVYALRNRRFEQEDEAEGEKGKTNGGTKWLREWDENLTDINK